VSARAWPESDSERDVDDAASDERMASMRSPSGQAPDARIGTKVGDIIIETAIAEGAMGRVYEARHLSSGRQAAIKILHDEAARDPVAVERFRREYETAFGFEHPHIVQVREFGETGDGSYFMTMEYLHGEPLSALLAREGRLAPERALRVVCQMASALEHAHSFGVIHRDLKPANILLVESDEGDVVKLLDFGSVKLQLEMGPKLTAYGMTLGSPSYMAPEQAEGKGDLDHRADVFALAAVTYEMLTGVVAFDGEGMAAVLASILRGEPVPASQHEPTLPLGIDLVLASGLRRDKDERIGSAREFAENLLRVFGLEADLDRYAKLPLEAWSLPRRERVRERSGMISYSAARDAPAPHLTSVWIVAGVLAVVVSVLAVYFAA
jgi:serine/threonine protein kinase